MNSNRINVMDSTDDAAEAREAFFDANYPGWDERDRFVDYADVADPDWTVVMHTFGGDHRGLIYGAFE